MKRIAMLGLAILLLINAAFAESSSWICRNCGQGGNTGNYCPNCASPRPDESEVNENLTQIPGEKERVSVNILRIDGSSYIKGKKDQYLYAPWNAIDEDSASCWQFSTKNIRKNPPWLCLVVEGQTVDEIWIRNGFQAKNSKGKDQYPLYSRLKDVTLVFVYTDENREHDTMEFTLTDQNTGTWDKLDTGRHEGVDLIWFYINSVYNGKSSSNACLSEIMLVQNAPADSAIPSWR